LYAHTTRNPLRYFLLGSRAVANYKQACDWLVAFAKIRTGYRRVRLEAHNTPTIVGAILFVKSTYVSSLLF
jgi:hypothetical protein